MIATEPRDRKAPPKSPTTRPGWPLTDKDGRPFHETRQGFRQPRAEGPAK